jgi:Domain of unknown function (DUF4388)
MPLKGALRDFSLPDLFQLIHFGKKNGTLVIANGDMMGYVCFRNGNVFFATHNWKRAPLGQRLIEAGMITQEQLDEALELQNTTHADQRVGNILVELGHLSRESLEVFVEEHIRDAVFNLLRWNEGDFDFDPDQIFPEEDIGLSMSTEDLIMEGSRRLDEWFQIEKKVPSLDSVFKVTKAPGKDASEMNLTSEEWLVLYHVDGNSTVRDIIAKSGQSALVTCKALYGLVTAGLVTLASEPAEVTGFASGLEDEVGLMLEKEQAAETETDRGSGEVEEEISIGETEDDVEKPRRRKRQPRSKKKVTESEGEVISFGDDSDEGVTIEEVAAGETEEAAPRRPKLRRKGKKAEEVLVEDSGEPESVVVEEEGDGPSGPEEEKEASAEAHAASEGSHEEAPAPGQSLVDYYKSLALRDFGDSEIYRETEERRAFMEQADRGELDGEEEHEFEILGSDSQEESAALTDEPSDIPLEWAGHLTRLRGRSSQPARGKLPKDLEEEGEGPEAEVVELDAYAAAREDAALVEEGMAAGPEEAEAGLEAGEQEDSAGVGVEAQETVEPDEGVPEVPEVEPVPDEAEAAGDLGADLIDETALNDDIMGGALEAMTGTTGADTAAPETHDIDLGSIEQSPLDEAGLQTGQVGETEAGTTESAPVDEAPPEAVEVPGFELEEEAAPVEEEDVEQAVQQADEVPEIPTIDDPAALDEASLPTEEDIERLIQASPPSREDLSREELLAFDRPTYAIQESREAAPVQSDGATEVEGEPADADLTHAELEETASRVQTGDAGAFGEGPSGQVISFSGARGEADVEVVLERPEPIVKAAIAEVLSVAEDLQVPVIEEVLGQTVARLEEPLIDEPPVEDEAGLWAAMDDAQAEAVEGEPSLGEEETESVLEIVGLEEPSGEIVSLDAGRPGAAEELEVSDSQAESEAARLTETREAVGDEEIFEVSGTAEEDEDAVAWGSADSEDRPAVAREEAYEDAETVESSESDPVAAAGVADLQAVGDRRDQGAAATETPAEESAFDEPEMAYDHIEDLRDITAGLPEEQADVEARADTDVEEVAQEVDELEIEADTEQEGLVYEEEEEYEDDGGLMGSLKVSGKRGKGTSLVDLETFELEQELLELAGGVQQRKSKVTIDKTQLKDDAKKEKKGRGGRSKGKEVDKGSVKKIIDDLKNK